MSEKCPDCNGTGSISFPRDGVPVWATRHPCDRCNGLGRINLAAQIIERKIAQLEKEQHSGIVFQYAQHTIAVLRDILIEMEGGRC
jgi:DnaJ-class molecular chaperone